MLAFLRAYKRDWIPLATLIVAIMGLLLDTFGLPPLLGDWQVGWFPFVVLGVFAGVWLVREQWPKIDGLRPSVRFRRLAREITETQELVGQVYKPAILDPSANPNLVYMEEVALNRASDLSPHLQRLGIVAPRERSIKQWYGFLQELRPLAGVGDLAAAKKLSSRRSA